MYNVGKCLLPDLLQQNKMTQQQLADKLSVTKQQINKYCRNDVIMTLPIAVNIAEFLNCDVKDLYDWKYVEVREKRR